MPRPSKDVDTPMDAEVCVHGVELETDCVDCARDEYLSDPFNAAYERAIAHGWSD